MDEVTAEDVAGGEVDEVVQNLALRITEVCMQHLLHAAEGQHFVLKTAGRVSMHAGPRRTRTF